MTAQTRTHAMADSDGRRLGALGSRIISGAAVVGVGALGLGLITGMAGSDKARFYRVYLMAFEFALSICLGALFFVILQHCVKAGWSVVVRRIAEAVASNLMWLWIAFIPVIIGMKNGYLYDWAQPEHAQQFAAKAAYLNVTFWLIRAVAFFAVWWFLAWFFVGQSVAQDETGDVRHTYRMQRFAPVAVGLYFVTQAFSSIDWVMSLEANWFSTMFPVYFFAASCCGFFAFMILCMFALQRGGKLQNEITTEHFHDAGKLLFAFGIVFWAYIAFSQYMLIWYANIPEETTWYMVRQLGPWLGVSLTLLLGHFLAPFLAIISRHPKRNMNLVAAAAGFMLLMHYFDVAWLVLPRVPEHLLAEATSYTELQHTAKPEDIGYGWGLPNLLLPVGMLALIAAGTAVKLSGVCLIPQRDPRLHESLAFENV